MNSNKAGEIITEIYRLLNEQHKGRTTYTPDDIKYFDRYWDYPSSTQKLKLAFKDEPIEFLEYYKNAKEEKLKKIPYNAFMRKGAEREVNALYSLINERKNSSDDMLQKLIQGLNNVTKPFHDEYIRRVEAYYTNRYDNLIQLKDFDIYDFMSFFGVMSEQRHDYIEERVKKRNYYGITRGELDLYWKFHSDSSRVVKSSKVPVKVFGVDYAPKEIRVAEYSRVKSPDAVRSDIPSKTTMDKYNGMIEVRGYKKDEYVTQQKVFAERQYQKDIALVADRVRKMNMDESKLQVLNIQNSAKGFDVVITDGVKKIYARSIFAAENSVLVTPHFRFIVTDRTGK